MIATRMKLPRAPKSQVHDLSRAGGRAQIKAVGEAAKRLMRRVPEGKPGQGQELGSPGEAREAERRIGWRQAAIRAFADHHRPKGEAPCAQRGERGQGMALRAEIAAGHQQYG